MAKLMDRDLGVRRVVEMSCDECHLNNDASQRHKAEQSRAAQTPHQAGAARVQMRRFLSMFHLARGALAVQFHHGRSEFKLLTLRPFSKCAA